MAEKVVLPKLGATMEEGTIDNWLIDVGEAVEAGDPIVEVQTDKITMEIEAEVDGILLKKLYAAGDTVPVQQTIAFIGESGENIADLMNESSKNERITEEQEMEIESENNLTVAAPSETSASGSIRRTPIARHLAAENNIRLSDISGTGPQGRIQKRDVEHYMEQAVQRITPLAQKMAIDQKVDTSKITGSGKHGKIVKDDIMAASSSSNNNLDHTKRVSLKGMRKVIADRISQSFYSAPHVTLTSEIDMTECVTLRKQLLPVIEESEGVRLSYNEIIVKATALSLKNHPNINISLENEKEIVYHPNIHIGIAVAVPEGLVVPVLHDVDKKGLGALTKEAKSMAKKALDQLLTPEEMQGSTFTISNLGMYAVDGFTPIINQPNAAILGVGRIQEKPVIMEGKVEARSMMTISLSFDHRIIDGAPAAQFLTDLKEVLEHPYKLII